MSLRMCSPYRPKNSGKFWIRKRVPRELKPVVGQTEIKRSLGTTDPKEARRLAPIVCAEIDQIISDARRSHYMDSTDVSRLVGEHFRDRRSKIKADAINQGWDWETLQLEQDRLTESLQKNLPKGLTETEYKHEADRRKAAAGQEWIAPTLKKHRLTPPDRLYHLIGLEGFRAYLEAYRAASAQLFGNAHRHPPEFTEQPELPDQATLPELFGDYVKASPELSPSTVNGWRAYIDRAHQFFEHRAAAQITRRDVQAFADGLIAGDEKATPRGKPLTGKTVSDNYIAALSAIYKFAIDRERLKDDPTYRIKVKRQKTQITGYSREQVKTILLASREKPSKRTKQETANIRRWIPWLAAFTGARIAELLWLERKDISSTEGITYINIQASQEEGEAKRVKTDNSTRSVPLHPAIIREGFLDYCRSLPEGEKYLFPGDWADQNGNRTKTPANKLRDWIKRQLPNADWKRLSPNHSFRHWMASECRKASINGDHARVLAGHEAKDDHGRYGPADVPILFEEIRKIPSPHEWK
ncbi:site-specific integrase [Marinobacter nauticus]